jgi:molecular chaperone DnaK (HSP70)
MESENTEKKCDENSIADIDDLINEYFNKKCETKDAHGETNLDSDTEKDTDFDTDSCGSGSENENGDKIKKIIREINAIYGKPINKKKNKNGEESKREEIVLGIDLGTSNSCCAVWRNGNVEIITDEFGNRTIPSVVAFTKKSRYIGQDAKNQTELNPKNVIYEVKRLMGKKMTDEKIMDDVNMMTYELESDANGNVLIKTEVGKVFTPEEISAIILTKIKTMASDYLKQEVKDVVISIPANYNDSQRQATLDAAKIAGLNCLRLINEPTAAALAYGLHSQSLYLKKKDTLNVIVYDFGGGTLDVSLMNIADGIFEVLGSTGNTRLGGADFDKTIMRYCMAYFKKQHDVKQYENLKLLSLQKLKRLAENAKKVLSHSSHTTIAIKDFYNGKDMIVKLTQTKMTEICRDLLLFSLEPLDDILNSYSLISDDIDEIIMVGGMTRMPAVRNMIERYLHKKPNISVNPDEVIAMGAAIQGYKIVNDDDPFSSSFNLLDITPLSLGIETIGGIMNVLIKKDTIIPMTKKRLYTTDSDYESTLSIKVFEGERKMTKDNFCVGEFELSGIEEQPRGVPEIEVTFTIDASGIITVQAEEKESGIKNGVTITGNKGRLSKEEISRMITEAKSFELKDKIERQKKQYYYEIDDLVSNVSQNLKSSDLDLCEDDKKQITQDIENIQKWLNEKSYLEREDDEYKNIIDKIKSKYATLILRSNTDNNVKTLDNIDVNATGVYDDENDKEIFDKADDDEMGLKHVTSDEKNDIKSMRDCLNDLCMNINDMMSSKDLNLDEDEIFDMKYTVDDTLLWIYVHIKATKNEYKIKIDELNTKCNELYEKHNNKLFRENEIMESIKNSKDELEQLCYLIKGSILCDVLETPDDTLLDTINENLEWLLDNCDETECKKRTQNINDICNKICGNQYSEKNVNTIFNNKSGKIIAPEMNNINQDIDAGGTSIKDLMKNRKKI